MTTNPARVAMALNLSSDHKALRAWLGKVERASLESLAADVLIHWLSGDTPNDIRTIESFERPLPAGIDYMPTGENKYALPETVMAAHAAWVRGQRQAWVIEGERTYQRVSTARRRAKAKGQAA